MKKTICLIVILVCHTVAPAAATAVESGASDLPVRPLPAPPADRVSPPGDTRSGTAPGPSGARHDDAALAAQVEARLASDGATASAAIDVDVMDGEVRLSGVVASDAAKRRAMAIARGVPGVRQVRNDLAVRRGAMTD